MRSNRILAAVAAVTLAAGVPLTAAAPAQAITPQEALSGTAGFGGYSSGSVVHTQVVSPLPTALANISLAQSAAGAAVGEELVDQDLLESSILFADPAGKNAYGHGSAVNVGLGQDQTEVPQVAPSTAEALSPPPTVAEPTELLSLPVELAQLAQAQLLPSTAQAQTTAVNSICPGGDGSLISEGTTQVANAQLLSPAEGQNVVVVGDAGVEPGDAQGVSSTVSRTELVAPSGGAAGFGLSTVSTQSIAPITLFKGIEGAETTIDVLANLQLRATATGGTGSELVYGFVDAEGNEVPDSEPVLLINGEGLTSEDVLGGDGLQLSLGVADVFIGAPAHNLDDDPTTDPTVSSTNVAGAADFIRIKVPGTVPTGTTMPVAEDSPLAAVLNPVLTPVVEALTPVLEGIQQGLADAGFEVADIRVGHFEALATVPAGGITCGPETPPGPDPDNPFREASKDVSAEGVAAGATFEYTVRFPNRGTEPVTDVTVVDTFTGGPPPLEFVSSDPAPTSQEGNTLTYDIGTIEPGDFVDISFVFRVPADAPVGTEYRNEATITGTYQGEEIEETVEVDAPTVIATPTGPCTVDRSTKYASNLEVVTGDQFAYYVNVSNTGGAECTGVEVTDTLIDGVTFVSCSDECTNEGQDVTWEVGTLAAGASTTLSVIVEVVATEGTLPNTADVTTNEGSTAQPSTPGPTVTDTSVGAPGNPAGCPATGCPSDDGVAAGGDDQLARTGMATTLPVLGALALLIPMALRRRRGSLIG